MLLNLNLDLKQIIFIVFFIMGIIVDYLIKEGYFGNKIKIYYYKFLTLPFTLQIIILFIIFLIVYFFLGYLGILPDVVNWDVYSKNIKFILSGDGVVDVNSYIGDNSSTSSSSSNGREVNVLSNKVENINITNPNLNVKVDAAKNVVNNVAVAISSTVGVALGVKVAQSVSVGSTVKVLVGVGTYLGIQVGTPVMSTILNRNGEGSSKTSKFVGNLLNEKTNNIDLESFPLN